MSTQAKKEEVALLRDKFEKSASLVLVDYRGLTANEMVRLRERFTRQGAEFRVVKDTLARIAAEQASLTEIAERFAGPVGFAISYADPVLAFKLVEKCRKEFAPSYIPKCGLFEREFVAEDEFNRYASLLSREELIAKLAWLLASPPRALAVSLRAKIRELAIVLTEVCKKREEDKEE